MLTDKLSDQPMSRRGPSTARRSRVSRRTSSAAGTARRRCGICCASLSGAVYASNAPGSRREPDALPLQP